MKILKWPQDMATGRSLVAWIKISFSGWRNEIRARRNRYKDGIAGEGLVRVSIGKLRSFAVERDKEMGQSLEKDVGTRVGFLMMRAPRTYL